MSQSSQAQFASDIGQSVDLNRQPTWCKFGFDNDFNLDVTNRRLSPPPGVSNGPTLKNLDRRTPNTSKDVPPIPSDSQSHIASPRTPATPIAGTATAGVGASHTFGVTFNSLTEKHGSQTPTLAMGATNSFSNSPSLEPATVRPNSFANSTRIDKTLGNSVNVIAAAESLQKATGQSTNNSGFPHHTFNLQPASQGTLSSGIASSSANINSISAIQPVQQATTNLALRPSAPHLTNLSHQVPRPQSTNLPNWDAPATPFHRPFSSADAYNQLASNGIERGGSRPGTANSQQSADPWMHDGTGNRSSHGTSNSANPNQTKRASILSFQTAISGGFQSGDDGRASSRQDCQETPEVAIPSDKAKAYLSHESSSDEPTLPGSMPGGSWSTTSKLPPKRPSAILTLQNLDSLNANVSDDPPRPFPNPIHMSNAGLSADQGVEPPKSPSLALSVPASSTAEPLSDDVTQVGVVKNQPASSSDNDNDGLAANSSLRVHQTQKLDNTEPLSDNVLPPPLPADVAAAQQNGDLRGRPVRPTAHRPVSDFRRKPLADISFEQQAAGLAHLQAQKDGNGLSDNASTGVERLSTYERMRTISTASLTPKATLTQPPSYSARDMMIDMDDSLSLEEPPSRESSPPPDGEVEARAEWERRQMKRKEKKQNAPAKPSNNNNASKNGTFRSQLKPLQLVPADAVSDDKPLPPIHDQGEKNATYPSSGAAGSRKDRLASASADLAKGAPSISQVSGAAFSTQQLQKRQAREQRHSVGALGAAVVASGSNGPYPVFSSPTTGPKKPGQRQYPGLMPQRSLVPPFELQQRPGGLPSALMGPDGIRKSINDSEVCLECMMRDEDMIDICVLGGGVWERESDKDFDEALRLEAEEEAKSQLAGQDGHAPSGGEAERPRPYKRIGKSDPLTTERLKLHTQMNPPASSHRWRTLQTFLAVQAKYIALEQLRLKAETDRKRTSTISNPAPSRVQSREPPPIVGNADVTSRPGASSVRENASPLRNRSASTSMLKNSFIAEEDDKNLTPVEKEEKERDIVSARAARNINIRAASSGQPMPNYNAGPAPAPVPVPRIPRSSSFGLDDDRRRFSTPVAPAAPGGDHLNLAASLPRRSMAVGLTQGFRAESSSQDLRSSARILSLAIPYPASPSDNLAPPARPFLSNSPSTPSRLASRSGASQLSLMHSGSMIDMHVGLEDRTEHRLNQTGFLPATPLTVESPGTMNRAYYGFPGDGDVSAAQDLAADHSRVISEGGYLNPEEARPEGMRLNEINRDASFKKKKKGFRGLLSKLTGGSSGGKEGSPTLNQAFDQTSASQNGSIASRNPSKRSQSSSSVRPRRTSFGTANPDSPLPPPNVSSGIGGLMSRARKSTSSLISSKLFNDLDRPQPQSPLPFQNPPGMASQTSLDLGPFQTSSPGMGSSSIRTDYSADMQKFRKASNPMIQKYLNSPPQMPSSPAFGSTALQVGQPPLPGPIPTEHRSHCIASYASSKDLRSQVLQTMSDRQDQFFPADSVAGGRLPSQANGLVADDKADQRSMSSLSRNSLRKELPPKPISIYEPSVTASPTSAHHRSGSSGMPSPALAVTSGRKSGSSAFTPRAPSSPVVVNTWSNPDGNSRLNMTYVSSPTAASGALFQSNAAGMVQGPMPLGSNPNRPPKDPRRPEYGAMSPSFSSSNGGGDVYGGSQFGFGNPAAYAEFPSAGSGNVRVRSATVVDPMDNKEKSRKSKLLRLPFGRKKRDSLLIPELPPIFVDDGNGNPSRFSVGLGSPPQLRSRKSYGGLAPPKSSFQTERQRVLSSPSLDTREGLPLRSQSAFGMLSTQQFMPPDGRQSINLRRSFDHGSDEGFGQDDGMDFDASYEPRGKDVSGGAASFGKKSLNLLREGFRMPQRQASGEPKKKRFGQ